MTGPLADRGEGIEPPAARAAFRSSPRSSWSRTSRRPSSGGVPLVTRLIIQFFGGVNWGALDYLLIDMPPGTSDVPLTVFQTIPIDGMVFVLTPQDLAALIVKKAMNMARDLHVPLLGVVENMCYLACPHCHERIHLFGAGGIAKIAEEYGIPVLAKLPVDPALSDAADHGGIEEYASPEVAALGDAFLAAVARQTSDTVTTL